MAKVWEHKFKWGTHLEINDMYSEVSCSKGKRHILATQQKDMSCGIACTAMVVARCRGLKLEESALRSYSACFDQGAYRAGTDAYSETGGTAMFNMEIMLKKMCVPCESKYHANVVAALKATSLDKPAIAHVQWAGSPGIPGGAHFIVVDGYNGENAVVCDPWVDYGFSEPNTFPSYNPQGASGRLSGWLLTVL